MHKKYGSHAKPPILLIHGGAGVYKDNWELLELRRSKIAEIIIPLLTRVARRLRKYPDLSSNSGHISASGGGVLRLFAYLPL